MIAPRPFMLLGLVLAVLPAAAQAPPTEPAPQAPVAAANAPPGGEHNVRLIARYKAMLAANPVEGLPLDRLWKAAQDQGSTAQLLDEYRHAAEATPPPAAMLLVYGHLLEKAGHPDEAKAAFQRAASADPSGALAPSALGDLASGGGHSAEAACFYAAAVDKLSAGDHRRPDLLLKLGNAWMAANQPLPAAEAWEKIVAADPANIGLHRRLAENYEKNHLPERAIAHYETIEQQGEPEQKAGALRELARLHEARGDFNAASAALERGLALTARDNWLHNELEQSLIRLYGRAGREAELATRWRAEVAKAPRDLGGYLRLERLASAQGDTEAQRTALEQIVALAPQDRPDTLKLARLLASAGERERSAALYDTLLKDQPGDLDLVLARAELDLQLGHAPAAVDRLEACVARAPADESVTTPALQFYLAHHLDAAAEKQLQADARRQPGAEEPALALAKFDFAERHGTEARAVLESLAAQPGPAPVKTARLLRIADCYKDEHLFDDAQRCWRQAADLSPAAPEPWLAAADALAGQARTAAAQDAYEHALKLMPPGAGQEAIAHKLFGLLQAADSNAAGSPGSSAPRTATALPGGGQLALYIARLEATARSAPSPAAYLRLARWESWNQAMNDAAIAAEKVITLDPGNLPARDLLVSVADETHQRDVAEQRLREIMALDPARSAVCQRQIAELKTEDGSFDEAIALFRSLQEDNPGSVAALTDLALAQQRADHWYDALTTWEHAYALPGATPTERADVRRPLLLVLERLEQFPRGAELLQAAVDGQTDPIGKQDLFAELTAYCQRHDLMGWLQKQYDARLAAQPTDYFTLTALAALQKAGGHEQEAYRLLRQADFSASDPVRSLQALVAAADALGETSEAVSWQRRLLALPGQDTADNLERLANLQDGGFAIDEAAKTWDQAVARYPRQSDVLDKAVDFFEKSRRLGRARTLLEQLTALDPANLQRVFHLGQLDLATDDRAGARVCFEAVLARSEAEKPGLPLVSPAELQKNLDKPDTGFAAAVARFRTRFTLAASEDDPVAAPPADERQLRLAAIREISIMLSAKGRGDEARPALASTESDRRQWLERWKTAAAQGAKSEPLWAFYFSRDQTLTMDAIAGWMREPGADGSLRNTFLAAGLRLGAYGVLAHWAWDEPQAEHTASNGQLLVAALIEYLTTGGKPGPGMVNALFPPQATVRELLWTAADEGFAVQNRYEEAATLGERVVALASSSRANFALPVVQWELCLGQVERARTVLRSALAEGVGDSFEISTNPVYVALREYFLLLPENERAGFADEYLRHAAERGGPAHAVLSAALLHGLAGDWKTAESDLDRLLSLRMLASDAGEGSADARLWTYLLNNGLQLQDWGLDPLAAHLWQRALRQASVFDQQDSESSSVRLEMRTRLLGLQVTLAADPAQARQEITDYLREEPPAGNVALLAAQFRETSRWSGAALLYEYLCRAEPADPEYWRDLFAAYQAEGDNAAYDQALETLLRGPQALPNSLSRVDLICREANVRGEEGDGEGARRLLEQARQRSPRSFSLLAQLANSYLLAGQTDKAGAIWREALPFDAEGRAALALATLEQGRNRRPEALAVLQAAHERLPGSLEVTVELGQIEAESGQIEALRALAASRSQAGDLNALVGIANGLAEPAARLALRGVLADAARRAHDPLERFRAQLGVVDTYRTRADDDAACELELRRLERLAGSTPALRQQFRQERFDIARQRGADAWLEADLTREWQDGQGDVESAAMLVRLFVLTDRAEALRKVAGEIDRRADIPELTLYGVEQALSSSKYAALALPLAERLTKRFPEKEAYALGRARVCWAAGRIEEARALLDTLDFSSVFVENIAERIGDLYAALGDRAGEREFYARAVARDPWAQRSTPAYLHLAQLELADKHFDAARRLLLVAYRNQARTDLTPLLAYLAATGRAEPDSANRLPGAEFPLGAASRGRLLTALCEGQEKTQPAEARRLALAHPELWHEAPGIVDYLCAGAGPGDWPVLTAALEDAVLQANPPSRQLAHDLGGLYARWATAELNENGRDAFAHLSRAHELQPDDFAIAAQLAELCLTKKQATRAAEVLRSFLAGDALPAERQQAQQILARK